MDYCSESITELAKALLLVQAEMNPAAKDLQNPFIGSRYASLNSVMEACRNALLAHGIWLTQLPVPAPFELGPGHIGLVTKLTHAESGQWQSSLTVVPLPKADPQGMGSAITYARRYALTAMLGMICEDDDGESAKLASTGRQPPVRQSNDKGKAARQTQTAPEDPFSDLPKLKGVDYQIVSANDGRECIIAVGDTAPRKEILSGAGFIWSPQRRTWWKFADAV